MEQQQLTPEQSVDPVAKPLPTLQKFFVMKMKQVNPDIDWEETDMPTDKANQSGWKSLYNDWVDGGCPEIIPGYSEKPKKQIRYLNRV